jgi:hypothetical protein
MATKSIPFANTDGFYRHLGLFYASWSAMDLDVDYAIGKLLKITPEQTHALVAGLEFGRKTALLRSLLTQSHYKNVEELKGYLTYFRKLSLRNVFTHSFIASDQKRVSFIHRKSQDEYSAIGYTFTAEDFVTHVNDFVQVVRKFKSAIGFSQNEVADFAAAAIKEEIRSGKETRKRR